MKDFKEFDSNKETIKNVVFVAPQFKNGGGNRVFVELSNSISNIDNYNVQIAYPNNSIEVNGYRLDTKVKVKVIGNLAENNFHKLYNCYLLFKFLLLQLKSNTTKIVISDPILCLFLFLLPSKYYSRIYRFIQSDDYRIYDDLFVLKLPVFLKIFKLMTKINFKIKCEYLFNSKFSYQKFLEISNRADVPIAIVHPAVDKTIFYSEEKEQKNGLSICLIARDHPLKKIDDFLNVWHLLPKETKLKIDAVYLISTDKLDKFDLSDFSVIRPKNDVEIASVFRKSDVFISTSLWEGFSLPPLEAMSCGMTILSSDSGGIREYAINEFNSLLYCPGNRIELQEKLIKIIEDKELRILLDKNAKEKIKEFSWDKSAKELISFIES